MGASNGAPRVQNPERVLPPSRPNRVVLLYEFGATEPKEVIPENTAITKYIICRYFNELLEQDVYIFSGPTMVKKFTSHEESAILLPPGSYTAVFERQLATVHGLPGVYEYQKFMKEMMEFEVKKGDLRNPSMYPHVAPFLRHLEMSTAGASGQVSAYYKIGATVPVARGIINAEKLTICALFGESIYQDVKIFYNSSYYRTLSNCVDSVDTVNPGKYVFVFKTDSIYNLSNNDIVRELKRLELPPSIENKNQRTEILTDRMKIVGKVSSNPDEVIVFYGFGETKSKHELSHNGMITKKYICSVFDESPSQEVHLFRGPFNFHSFLAEDKIGSVFLDYDEYVVVFQKQILEFKGLMGVAYHLIMMFEMLNYDQQKGDLRCEKTYPAMSGLIQKVEQVTKEFRKYSVPRSKFYAVGGNVSILEGLGDIMKITVCALFNRSITEGIKVFHNNSFKECLTNCFGKVHATTPGKYVIVFESDDVYNLPIITIQQRLAEEEEQKVMEEQRKKKVKEEEKESTVSFLKGEVFLYGYGCLEPKITLKPGETIDKYMLCITFGQQQNQRVYIFNKAQLAHTFRADANTPLQFGPGKYTVMFEKEAQLDEAQWSLVMLHEMNLWEKSKGSLRSEFYSASASWIKLIETGSRVCTELHGTPGFPSIYGVGDKEPTVCGLMKINKVAICALFNRSIYQDVKLFHNYRLHDTISNCCTSIDVPEGKSVVVFNTDAIYNRTPDEIAEELRKMDMKLDGNDVEKKKIQKPKKNNKKTSKKKQKKQPQRNQKKSEKQANSIATPIDETEPDIETEDEVNQESVVKEKKGKEMKAAEESTAASIEPVDADESVPSSDIQEPTVALGSRFSILKDYGNSLTAPENVGREVDDKSNPLTQEEESLAEILLEVDEDEEPQTDQEDCEDLLERVMAESVPFEKPKVYARNRNQSFTYEPSAKIEEIQPKTANGKFDGNGATVSRSSCSPDSSKTEGDDAIFEEIPVKQVDDSFNRGRAVVVGIHSRGLIVQTLPPNEFESEFLLLDYCSQCTTTGRSLTDVAFDVKVLHVFLKVISVATLGNDVIVNENMTQKGRRIENRIATYALDGDTWTRGRFKRGRRDSIDEELKLKKKERKIIALIVETDEEDKADIVRVVGPPSHLSFLAQLDKTRMRDEYSPLTQNIYFKREEFIMADSFQADPFFKLHIMFDTLCLVKTYQAEENFNHLARKMENMYMELQKCLRVEEADVDSILLKNFPHTSDPPTGDTFLFNIQKLTKKDKDQIRTCCKEMAIQEKKEKKKERKRKKKNKKDPEETEEFDPEEQYNIFRLYIRDPALSICRFNSYAALKSSQLYTIRARARLIVERGELRLLIILDNDQVNQVLHPDKRIDVKNIWVEGSQLKIFNPVLEREKQTRFGLFVKSDADVVIDEIQIQRGQVPSIGKNGQPVIVEAKRARVTLRPAKNSKDIFSIIQEFHADFYKEFSQIGPAARDGASEALASGLLKFNVFYRHPRFFNWWRGFPDGSQNVDYLQNMLERIEIPNGQNPRDPFRLDSSQSAAYQHAYHREGITSIAAGPGSGKTLLSGGLICQCQTDRVEERMIVTASTNQGVDNAVQKIAKLSPGFPISREMSKKGEDTVEEKLRQYCLQYQSLESEQTNPVLLRVRKEYRKVLTYYEKARTLRQKLNRLELLHFAESKVKRTYLRTIAPFCAASTPALLVRHADHYCWVIEDQDNMKHRHWPTKHLVVDEASQLPYYTSLALCCSYPNLERITVMGDRMQLGPHCVLQNTEGLLSDLCRLSELDRINGLRTVEEFSLRMNYRSHNWIVENFEQPHYGNTFISGLRPEARMLAYNLDLPLFKIRSKNAAKPVAFIDINSGEDCHNASERGGVLRLLELLMEKGANPIGISVLCFHRKQKEEMEKCLKPSNFQKLKMSNFVLKIDGVYTIDSFQGRENDIIIVCTTKSGKYYPGLFKFVADPRRGLVAVSRAKEAMYIFGQWKYLQKTSFWKDKVALMKKENLLYDQNFEVV